MAEKKTKDGGTKVNAAGTSLVRDLPVPLSESEIRQAGKDFARAHHDLESLRKQKQAALGGFNKRIADQTDKVNELAQIVATGEKIVEIELQEFQNHTEGKIELRRVDTDEVVDSRPMTAADRQQHLPMPIAGDPDDVPPVRGDVEEAHAVVESVEKKAALDSKKKGNVTKMPAKKPAKK